MCINTSNFRISQFEKRKSYFQDSQRKLERDYSTDCERKTNPSTDTARTHVKINSSHHDKTESLFTKEHMTE